MHTPSWAGEFILTTIDARVIVKHLMNLGQDLFQRQHDFVITLGAGACKLCFPNDTVHRIFQQSNNSNNIGGNTTTTDDNVDHLFGLEYSFTLVEGSDDEAGVGRAVDLPEYLAPLPLLVSLAQEVGLELVCEENFHQFYAKRKSDYKAHSALLAMHVPNWQGTISAEEWEISRLYCAVKFRKVSYTRENRIDSC